MDIPDIVFAAGIIAFYFRLFDYNFYLKRGALPPEPPTILMAVLDRRVYDILKTEKPDNLGLVRAGWFKISLKTALVISPAIATLWIPVASHLVQILAFVGLTLLLGPVSTRGPSTFMDINHPTSIFSWRNLKYTIGDKFHSLQLILQILVFLWLLKLSTGYQLSLAQYIPRAPYFPVVRGKETASLFSDAVWCSMAIQLFFKTWFSVLSTPNDFMRSWAIHSASAIVAFMMSTIVLEYTGFLPDNHHTFGISYLFSIICRW